MDSDRLLCRLCQHAAKLSLRNASEATKATIVVLAKWSLCKRGLSPKQQHDMFCKCKPVVTKYLIASLSQCHASFQKLKEEKGTLQWATIRAVLVRKMTERKISTLAATTEVTPLPLSVLLAQGWEEQVVKKFESETSETYGVEVSTKFRLQSFPGRTSSRASRRKCCNRRKKPRSAKVPNET